MNDNPTIQDILNWYSNWEKSPEQEWSELNLFPGIQMGQMPEDFKGRGFALQGKQDMASYMYGLLEDAGHAPEDIGFDATGRRVTTGHSTGTETQMSTYTRSGDVPIADILGQLFTQDIPFEDMSEEDLEVLFRGELGGVAPDWYPSGETVEFGGEDIAKYSGGSYDQGSIDEMVKFLQKLQEGVGVMGGVSPEAWGLGTKLGDVEESAERESKQLLQSYIPSETESRYKALAGGSPVEGELAEAEYLAQQFGGQRQLGRDVGDIYGQYEEDVFGRLSDFISNLG